MSGSEMGFTTPFSPHLGAKCFPHGSNFQHSPPGLAEGIRLRGNKNIGMVGLVF